MPGVAAPAPKRTPERLSSTTDAIYRYLAPPCDGAGAGVVGAAGAIGFGEVEPEPVVLGVLLIGALLVAVGDEPLLAVLLVLFQPAMIRKTISSRAAMPAIQPPHSAGSTVVPSKRIGKARVCHDVLHSTYFLVSDVRNPRATPAVPLSRA